MNQLIEVCINNQFNVPSKSIAFEQVSVERIDLCVIAAAAHGSGVVVVVAVVYVVDSYCGRWTRNHTRHSKDQYQKRSLFFAVDCLKLK